MKFIMNTAELKAVLAKLGRAVSKNPVLPILECVKIDLEASGIIRFTTTDLSRSIVIEKNVKVEKVISFCVNYSTLTETVNLMNDDFLKCQISKDYFNITAGTGKFKTRLMPAKDFVKISDKIEESFSVDSAGFVDSIKRVAVSASTQEMQPHLNSVFIKVSSDGLVFCSTDVARLCEIKKKVSLDDSLSGSFLVNKKDAESITFLIDKSEDLRLGLSDKELHLLGGDIYIRLKLLDMNFINYEPHVPQKSGNVFSFDKKSFVSAVSRVNLFSNPKDNMVTLFLSNDEIKLSSQYSEYQLEASEVFEGDYSGEQMELKLNGRLLKSLINTVYDEDITLYVNGSSVPVLGISEDVENDLKQRIMIMPIR